MGWLIYWSVGAVALTALLIAGDANVKSFVTAVGFWPVFLVGTGYFLAPLVWARLKEL
jgi:hypothetical protein